MANEVVNPELVEAMRQDLLRMREELTDVKAVQFANQAALVAIIGVVAMRVKDWRSLLDEVRENALAAVRDQEFTDGSETANAALKRTQLVRLDDLLSCLAQGLAQWDACRKPAR